MAKTIVGLYDDRATARRALDDLKDRGFGEDHLRFASREKGSRFDFEVDADDFGTPDAFSGYGIPNDEAGFYAEGLRRGGAIIIARVHDGDAETAAEIMARHNPVRYEDRKDEYLYQEAEPYKEKEMVAERERYADQTAARLKEIEEHMKIGKREVVRGGVRVHKYVETDIEQETLRLREEHIDVDRTRVDRALSPEEADAAFKEETVELTETDEEAVVSKEARVVGEVAVGKDVSYREETVGGEVRATRVEVERTGGSGAASSVTWVDVEPAFREHYGTAYASAGNDYGYYEPAYRYGYEMATDSKFRDRDYNTAEADLRKGYVDRHDEGLWDETKDAVRHAYNSVRRAV